MIVYRVETERGEGPYTSGIVERAMNELGDREPMDTFKCPEPFEDIPTWSSLMYEQRKYLFFGFKSLDQIRSWFTPAYLLYLESAGAYVYEFHVPDSEWIAGKKQLVFVRKDATRLRRVKVEYTEKQIADAKLRAYEYHAERRAAVERLAKVMDNLIIRVIEGGQGLSVTGANNA